MKQFQVNIAFLMLSTTQIYATNSIQIERSKQKIQNPKTTITQFNKKNFEKMILEPKNNVDDHISKLADKIILGPHAQIKGIDIHRHTLNKKLREAEKLFSSFHWGKDTVNILKNYKQSNISLTDFIKDIIHTEEDIISTLTNINSFIKEHPGILQTNAQSIENATTKLLNFQKQLLDILEIINNLFDKKLI
jgi:hypothetical protein